LAFVSHYIYAEGSALPVKPLSWNLCRMQNDSKRVAMSAIATMLLLAGCASVDRVCRAGLAPMSEAELFFGRDIHSHAVVSDEEWRRFVDDEIAPRFPDGFTVDDSTGQWRSKDGTIVREVSKRLTIVLRGTANERKSIDAIREAYKRRFQQESVLLLEYPVCGSF
jgi:hypothetical protein